MPSVILLPGLACDAGLWSAQLPAMAARHAVRVSTVQQRADSLPDMAALLLRELPPGPQVLVGASMGGMVAMHAALQAPQRVAGLALLGTSARADTPELVRLRTEACERFAQGRMDEVLRANVMFAFHPDQANNPAMVDAYLAMIGRAGAAQLIRQNRAVMARPDLRPELPRIACPTLVAVGEADQLTTPEHAQEIAGAIPGARLHTVAGAGHMLTMEQPEAVTGLLLQWLDSLAWPASAHPVP
jgi:pimeloyl-ACP methyl ester carboxylesterase